MMSAPAFVQMSMAASSKTSAGYLMLLLPSLVVPGLHYLIAARAIEHTRSSIGLLPGYTLFLRWLGELSCVLPMSAVVFFALSFRREWFNRPSTLFGLAAAHLGFITFYASYCTFLLSRLFLER